VPQVPGLPKAFGKRETDRIAKSAHLFGLDVEAMVLLALLAGLRRSEIRWLEWANIDLEEGWISVKREGGAKGGRERAVSIHPELSDVLRGWQRESTGSGRYVSSPTSTSVNPGA
jgi:integrase